MSNASGIKPRHIDSGGQANTFYLRSDGSGGSEFVELSTEQAIQVQFNSNGGDTTKTVFIASNVNINSINFNLSDIASLSYSTVLSGGGAVIPKANISEINNTSGDKYLIISATYAGGYSGLASIEILYTRS